MKTTNKFQPSSKTNRTIFKKKSKLFYLFAFLIAVVMLCSFNKAHAVNTVTINYVGDSIYNSSCTIPQTRQIFFYATASGYKSTDKYTATIDFGDGTASFTQNYMLVNGVTLYGWTTHSYTAPGNYNVRVILTAPDGVSDTLVEKDLVVISSNCGNIKGQVYADDNGNCIMDNNDTPLANAYLNVFEGTKLVGATFTDNLGNYSVDVPAGPTYEVKLPSYYTSYYNISAICPASGVHTVASLPSVGNDFALNCSTSNFDLEVNMNAGRFRPGVEGSVYVCVKNKTCMSQSGLLKIIVPSNLSVVGEVNNKPYQVVGDTVIFNFSNSIFLTYTECFQLKVLTDVNATIGDSVIITTIVAPLAGDVNPANNIKTGRYAVRNSYDPNDKVVTAPGMKSNGDISPKVTEMNYTINFQNTGNDVAYDVFILDTLSANLDLSTLKVNESSHKMKLSIINKNVLRFNFDSIMLIDDKANEPKSHGFVNYSIKTKSALPVGSTIKNTAYIYFDFNPAIVTNTTLNTVSVDVTTGIGEVNKSANSLSIFPNPFSATTNITYSISQKSNVLIELYNLVGEKVLELENAAQASGTHQVSLNAANLNAGVYLVKLVADGETSVKRIIVSK